MPSKVGRAPTTPRDALAFVQPDTDGAWVTLPEGGLQHLFEAGQQNRTAYSLENWPASNTAPWTMGLGAPQHAQVVPSMLRDWAYWRTRAHLCL
eukprot:11612834-Alexandrium_andersonii.AAC.1